MLPPALHRRAPDQADAEQPGESDPLEETLAVRGAGAGAARPDQGQGLVPQTVRGGGGGSYRLLYCPATKRVSLSEVR